MPAEDVSRINPASPTVCPSWMAMVVCTLRSAKVGELMPGVVRVELMSLTSWAISSVTSPPAPMRGVTSRITPVWR